VIGQTAEEFVVKEVLRGQDLENKKAGLTASLVKKAANWVLWAAGVPEQYGGPGWTRLDHGALLRSW